MAVGTGACWVKESSPHSPRRSLPSLTEKVYNKAHGPGPVQQAQETAGINRKWKKKSFLHGKWGSNCRPPGGNAGEKAAGSRRTGRTGVAAPWSCRTAPAHSRVAHWVFWGCCSPCWERRVLTVWRLPTPPPQQGPTSHQTTASLVSPWTIGQVCWLRCLTCSPLGWVSLQGRKDGGGIRWGLEVRVWEREALDPCAFWRFWSVPLAGGSLAQVQMGPSPDVGLRLGVQLVAES